MSSPSTTTQEDWSSQRSGIWNPKTHSFDLFPADFAETTNNDCDRREEGEHEDEEHESQPFAVPTPPRSNRISENARPLGPMSPCPPNIVTARPSRPLFRRRSLGSQESLESPRVSVEFPGKHMARMPNSPSPRPPHPRKVSDREVEESSWPREIPKHLQNMPRTERTEQNSPMDGSLSVDLEPSREESPDLPSPASVASCDEANQRRDGGSSPVDDCSTSSRDDSPITADELPIGMNANVSVYDHHGNSNSSNRRGEESNAAVFDILFGKVPPKPASEAGRKEKKPVISPFSLEALSCAVSPSRKFERLLNFPSLQVPTEKMKCYVERRRGLLSNTYYLYVEKKDSTPSYPLIVAQRSFGSSSLFKFWDLQIDAIQSVKKLNSESENYIGFMKATEVLQGLEFMVYTRGNAPSKRGQLEMLEARNTLRYECGLFINSPSRQLCHEILIPTCLGHTENQPTSAGDSILAKYADVDLSLGRQYKSKQDNELLYLRSTHKIALDDRVRVSSTKNFIVREELHLRGEIPLVFGKRKEDIFVLDFKAPLSPYMAFALALSRFVH